MKRRTLLKTGFASAAGAALAPLLSGYAKKSVQKISSKASAIQLTVDALNCFILTDGLVKLDKIQPTFAPDIAPVLLQESLRSLHLSDQKLEAGINVLLILYKDKLILFDTGSGHYLGDNAGKLVPNLKELGINPEDITDIIITHAHLDHIGGIFDQDGDYNFKNAQYHIAKTEFDFWMSPNPDFSTSKNPSIGQSGISFSQGVLKKLTGKLKQFEYGDLLFDCIKSEIAPGHTPGHTAFTIFSGDKSFKHIVDAIHSELLIQHPDWGTQWDQSFEQANATRKRIIEEGYRDQILYMSCHLTWPGLGYIQRINDAYGWKPISYPSPHEITL